MAGSNPFSDYASRTAVHFSENRPLIPMYIHLIISALAPIFAGAHASLSQPSSAADPAKKDKESATDSDDEEDDEDDTIQKMEGLSNSDAILLPIIAGLVLTSLYFLIKRYGADLINIVMGYYFSFASIMSVTRLINHSLKTINGFIFPTHYRDRGALWKVKGKERKVVKRGPNGDGTRDSPLPALLGRLPLPGFVRSLLWLDRQAFTQKYTITAYISNVVDLVGNTTLFDILSAFGGVGTILYMNFVSKPWFLANFQGFAMSYFTLQVLSPSSFTTGSLILSGLFFYDIWAVFFTPLMVTVATNLDQPIKLVFPHPDDPSQSQAPGKAPDRSFSMLGLGDIILPGMMVGLALRFDLYMFYLKKQKRGAGEAGDDVEKAPYVPANGHWGDRFWTYGLPASSLPPQLRTSFPKPYFVASTIGYIAGMLTTLFVMSVFHHGQPALLYLVPGVLVSLWVTGLARGEAKEMWNFSETFTTAQPDEGDGTKSKEEEPKEGDNAKSKKEVPDPTSKGLFERLRAFMFGSKEDKDDPSASVSNDPKPKSDEKSNAEATSEPKPKSNEKSVDETKKSPDDRIFVFSVTHYNPELQKKKDSNSGTNAGTQKVAPSPSEVSSASRSTENTIVVPTPDPERKDVSTPRRRTRGVASSE